MKWSVLVSGLLNICVGAGQKESLDDLLVLPSASDVETRPALFCEGVDVTAKLSNQIFYCLVVPFVRSIVQSCPVIVIRILSIYIHSSED